jgi:hypothetical protein
MTGPRPQVMALQQMLRAHMSMVMPVHMGGPLPPPDQPES